MWFHGTYLKDKFHAGQKIALYGKLEGSRSGNALHAPPGSTRFKMIQPTFEILPDSNATGEDAEFILLEMGRIVPVYEYLGGKAPTGSKLTSRWTRRILWTIFKDLAESEPLSATSSTTQIRVPQVPILGPGFPPLSAPPREASRRPRRTAKPSPPLSARASNSPPAWPPSATSTSHPPALP